MRICFHGTTKENADKILVGGFETGTYFAAHLEDALAFGGEHVFFVRFEEDKFNFDLSEGWWQFHTREHISNDHIWKLICYSPVLILDRPHVVKETDDGVENPEGR